jgi:hypothetical protein
VFGFGIGINVRVPRPPLAKHFLMPSLGYECCFYRHSGPHRVRILSIWNCWRVRYTSGWSPVLGRLHSRSRGTSTQVAVIIGEIIGHFSNDAIMRVTTRRNKGVFEAESRLWWVQSACLWGRGSNSSMVVLRTHRACYIGVPLYICGFLVLGDALKKHDSVGELVVGWGIAMVALMVNTVAVCTFLYVCPHS